MSYDRDTLPDGVWCDYAKRGTTRATRVDGPFEVVTREGTMSCPDGWLALDSNGDPNPIAADVFEAIYELVEAAS